MLQRLRVAAVEDASPTGTPDQRDRVGLPRAHRGCNKVHEATIARKKKVSEITEASKLACTDDDGVVQSKSADHFKDEPAYRPPPPSP